MYLLLLLIFQLLTQSNSNEKIIKLQYSKIGGRYHLVHSVKLSNNLGITLFNSISLKKHTYIASNYLINESEYFKHSPYTIIEINNNGIQCKVITTELTFDENTKLNFTFLNSKETNVYLPEEAEFPFPVKIKDQKYSLLYQAYKDKHIDKLIFAFENISKEKGYLYLGGLPLQTKKGKYENKCQIENKLNKYESLWGCKLNYVYIGNYHKQRTNVYMNNQNYYSSFDTNISHIISPGSFIEYLRDNLFYDYINNSKCTYHKNEGTFECICDIFIDKLSSITFSFGKEFTIQINKLASIIGTKEDKYCKLNIIKNQKRNEWIFGTSFLNNYDIEFYPEQEEIIFFSGREFTKGKVYDTNDSEINNKSSLKMLFIIIISMESICGFELMVQKLMINLNKNSRVNLH